MHIGVQQALAKASHDPDAPVWCHHSHILPELFVDLHLEIGVREVCMDAVGFRGHELHDVVVAV